MTLGVWGKVALTAYGAYRSYKASKNASSSSQDTAQQAAAAADPFASQRGYYQDLLRGIYGQSLGALGGGGGYGNGVPYTGDVGYYNDPTTTPPSPASVRSPQGSPVLSSVSPQDQYAIALDNWQKKYNDLLYSHGRAGIGMSNKWARENPMPTLQDFTQGGTASPQGVMAAAPGGTASTATIGPDGNIIQGSGTPTAGGGALGAVGEVAQIMAQQNQAQQAGSSPNSLFENLPGYQFSLDQGIKSLSRSAAAKKMLNSGNYMYDLMGYAQGTAAQTYNSEMNRLMTLAGADKGSPAAAGQFLQSGANTAAGWNQQAQGNLGYGLSNAVGAITGAIQNSQNQTPTYNPNTTSGTNISPDMNTAFSGWSL